MNIINASLTKEQTQYDQESFYKKMVVEDLEIHMNLDINFIPFTKFNSKWIIDLNAKYESITLCCAILSILIVMLQARKTWRQSPGPPGSSRRDRSCG